MMRVARPLALCLPLLLTLPAWAQVPPPVMDQVVLDLTAEDWVGTETARVTVSADAAATGSDAGTQRADLLKAIGRLAPDAEWRIVSFDRSTDQAGLERWRAVAEARLAENALGRSGRQGAAGQPSRPATPHRLDRIHPHARRDGAVRARLRAEIYGKAAAELKALEQNFPGRKFRMGNIDFADQPPMAYVRKTREDMQPMAMAAALPGWPGQCIGKTGDARPRDPLGGSAPRVTVFSSSSATPPPPLRLWERRSGVVERQALICSSVSFFDADAINWPTGPADELHRATGEAAVQVMAALSGNGGKTRVLAFRRPFTHGSRHRPAHRRWARRAWRPVHPAPPVRDHFPKFIVGKGHVPLLRIEGRQFGDLLIAQLRRDGAMMPLDRSPMA